MDYETRQEHSRFSVMESDRDSFFENAGIGICCISPSGEITRINRMLLDLCGYAYIDCIGRHLAAMFTEVAQIDDILSRVVRGAKISQQTAHLFTRDGVTKPVSINAEGCFIDGEFSHARIFISVLTNTDSDLVALHRSERRFRDAADNFPDIFAIYDRDRRFRYVNAAGLTKAGLTLGEMLGKRDEDVLPAELTRTYVPALKQAYETGVAQTLDVTVTVRGKLRIFLVRLLPQLDGKGYVDQILSIAHDVTDLREVDRILRASEARLQLALEAGEMGAWQWNIRTGENIWWPGMDKVHGLPPGVVPASMEEYERYIHPDDRCYVRSVFQQAVWEHKEHRVEYRVVWPDGSVHWIEARGKLATNGQGRPHEMAGICMDITRRKRTEQDLRFLAQASSELASLNDHQQTLDRIARLAVPSFADWCAVDLLDDEGELQRVAVAHVDPAKVQIVRELRQRFPYPQDASFGAWQVMRTGEPEYWAEVPDELLLQVIPDPGYPRLIRSLGLRSYICVPLATRGHTLGVVTFVTAESGRVYGADDLALAQDLARRAAVAIENASLYRELQEADQRKDLFLATLSHELRNPLAPIVNALGILKLCGREPQRIESAVNLIERQTTQLTRLVDDLLDIARITTGKIELRKTNTDLVSILNSAVETSRPHIDSARHSLSLELPEQAAPLHVDPVRLEQVFSNLLNNAAKYTDAGGAIRMRVDTTPDELIVRIQDNGIGMSPATLKIAFAAFVQGEHMPGRTQGGLGIGLTLADMLVRLHGGRVEAHSEGLGCGSTFSVYLPRTTSCPAESHGDAALLAAVNAPQSGRRILVVDDNVDGALTIAEILEMLGHEVTVVHDGLAAVDHAASSRPDIILLDIGLPGIDGYEAARRIRAQSGGTDILLIALTGWGQDKDKQQAAAAGFDQHWVKPVDFSRLAALSTTVND